MPTTALGLENIEEAQAQKELTANSNFLTIDYSNLTVSVAISNGTNNLSEVNSRYGTIILTGALTLAATVVLHANISKNTRIINKTTGKQIVTIKHSGQTGVTIKYNESIILFPLVASGDGQRNVHRRISIAMTTADYTASENESCFDSIETTGTIGAARNFVITNDVHQFIFYNNTTGGFAVTVKTAAGSGISIAATKRAILECDGTNIVRITPDT